MKEKIIDYGTTHEVKILDATSFLITAHAEVINEGFLLIGHNVPVKDLPKAGDRGKIIFERDSRKGHWQWHPIKSE